MVDDSIGKVEVIGRFGDADKDSMNNGPETVEKTANKAPQKPIVCSWIL